MSNVGKVSVAAVMLGLATACGSSAEAAPAVQTHLSCAGGLTVSMVADHDESFRETRSPEQLAKNYAAAVGGSFLGQQNVVYRSAERVDISFVDGGGQTQAVLSYRHRGQGWRLEEGVNCP